MIRGASNVGAMLQFAHRAMSKFDQTASFIPSSRYLVDALLEPVPLAKAKCVVELGTGTGVVTEGILRRLGPHGHVHAIEIDEGMLQRTAETLGDARLRPTLGSAEEIQALLHQHGCTAPCDAVISSLGLSLFPLEMRDRVLASVAEVLSSAGVFMQFSYLHTRFFVYSQTHRKVSRWYARPFLEEKFQSVKSRLVPANFPPAVVYTCHGVRAHGDARPTTAP